MTASQQPTEPSESCSSVETHYVPPIEVTPSLVRRILPYLQPAMEAGGEMDDASLLLALGSGRLSLWIVRQREDGMIVAAVATRIATYDNDRRVLVIQLAGSVGAGGRRLSIADMRSVADTIVAFSARLNLDAVRIYGRRGWAKVLPGFTERMVILERAL